MMQNKTNSFCLITLTNIIQPDISEPFRLTWHNCIIFNSNSLQFFINLKLIFKMRPAPSKQGIMGRKYKKHWTYTKSRTEQKGKQYLCMSQDFAKLHNQGIQ